VPTIIIGKNGNFDEASADASFRCGEQ
jgi:hypothetical protein